jgi:nucleoside-diphosphate kinase
MKKEPALIIIKPDGVSKKLIGHILTKFAETDLELVAIKIAKPTRALAEEHYKHIRKQPFFEGVIAYFLGKFHLEKKLLAIIYYGTNAIKKCREAAGATNPEEAAPASIRGSFGRITTQGIFENVVHVSSDKREAEREIKLWFSPDDITVNLYKTKTVAQLNQKKVWA